jgi:hypothetical protein
MEKMKMEMMTQSRRYQQTGETIKKTIEDTEVENSKLREQRDSML